MQRRHFTDPVQFAECIEPLGTDDPLACQHVRTALWPGAEVDSWVVFDSDRPVGAALNLGGRWAIAPSAPGDEVIRTLAPLVCGDGGNELLGAPNVVAALAGACSERTGGSYAPVELLRIYVAGSSIAEPATEGCARPAVDGDLGRMAEWAYDMAVEVGERPDRAAFRSAIERRHAHQQFWIWDLAGEPVAQLFRSREAFGHVRIAGVFTPPMLRGRGFGGALTAVVTRNLQATGLTAMLNTQAHNSGSNRVYRNIGYTWARDLLIVGLHRPEQSVS